MRQLEIGGRAAIPVTDIQRGGKYATELVLAPSTIKTHINNLYRKIGVRTRAEVPPHLV